jgi:hypothetical protein
VRLRLKQRRFVFCPHSNVVHYNGRRPANRNSVRILRDRQSWSRLHAGGAAGEPIAYYSRRGAWHVDANSAPHFIHNGRRCDFIHDRIRSSVCGHRDNLRDRRDERDPPDDASRGNAQSIFSM